MPTQAILSFSFGETESWAASSLQTPPATVAAQIRNAEKPIDQRTATPATLTTGGQSGTFLQYPDYVIGLFDYGTDQTRVMVSKDYTTGYTHYHNYVGRHWVPTPAYSGSGSSNRGGGSGSGK